MKRFKSRSETTNIRLWFKKRDANLQLHCGLIAAASVYETSNRLDVYLKH